VERKEEIKERTRAWECWFPNMLRNDATASVDYVILSNGMSAPTSTLQARSEQAAAGSPQQHNPFVLPPQCQTSRRFMDSTDIQTYGSSGTGGSLLGRRMS
jgi:hypothetical protein